MVEGVTGAWVVGVVNGRTNGTLCLTSFQVLHSTTYGHVCIHQQVAQTNTMKEYTRTLIIATYFL